MPDDDVRRLQLNKHKRLDYSTLVRSLQLIDEHLSTPVHIELCGSSSVLMQKFDFRETMNIDFCVVPPEEVMVLIAKYYKGTRLFDYQVAGVIGLLIDYEDRLVKIDLVLSIYKYIV